MFVSNKCPHTKHFVYYSQGGTREPKLTLTCLIKDGVWLGIRNLITLKLRPFRFVDKGKDLILVL